jgi:uncharacterized membrane protein YdjX (TVP38/TMEM64 family)
MMRRSQKPLLSIIFGILLVAVALLALLHFVTEEEINLLLDWLQDQGHWAVLWFILIMAVAVVLLLPGFPLTTGAGFLFGVGKGTFAVVLGTTLGALAAMLLARYLFGQRLQRWLLRRSGLLLISEKLAGQAFKIVLLTRMVPFFPFKLSNYLFGIMRFPTQQFTAGTFLGIVPFSLHNVYLGALAADIATLGIRSSERSVLEWGLYGAGFLATIAVVLTVNKLAREALDENLWNAGTDEQQQQEDKTECGG